MRLMAQVEALYKTRRGRFAVLVIENLPKGEGHLMRFHAPSEILKCGERVTVDIELHVKKPKAETAPQAVSTEVAAQGGVD